MKNFTKLTSDFFTILAFAICGLTPCSIYAQNTFPTTGNVGIGTSTPSAGLDVNANMVVDSSLKVKESVEVEKTLIVDQDVLIKGNTEMDGELKLMKLRDTVNNENLYIFIDPNGELKGGQLSNLSIPLYTGTCFPLEGPGGSFFLAPKWEAQGGPNANDPKLYTGVDCPANVGIGTDDPIGSLDVRGNSYFQDNMVIGQNVPNAQAGLNANFAIDLESIQQQPFYAMLVRDENDQLFMVTNDGKVGVGVNTGPAAMMHINRRPSASNDMLLLSTGVDEILRIGDEGDFTLTADPNVNNVFLIKSGSDELFKIKNDGLLQTREVIVTLNQFADYVFDSSYQLMPIDSVENFIDENKRLPNYPPEAELIENGASVNEMMVKQQATIEEMMLYIIELNKKMQAMQVKIDELEEKEG